MRHPLVPCLVCFALFTAVPGTAQPDVPDLLTGQPRAAAAFATGTADTRQAHPIDREIYALLEKDPSTAGQMQAFERGIELWDAELNRAYKTLSAKLGEEDRKALKDAQRAWIAFRDAEFRRTDRLYGGKDGSMFIPMSVAARMELVRARALELVQSIEILGM
ncbi:MAG TPA: DUF1311 domain-containing protein [Candidatus Ozemobacteraceae bacterium]|nr:DUF1311 domain-containing protein [Candidatus Ozemobacteraceae bacterium]